MPRLLLALLCVAAAVQAAPDAEAKLKGKLAQVWVDCARVLKVAGLREQAEYALARAREADPAAEDLEKLSAEVAALDAGGEPGASARKQIEKAAREAAKLYDRLAKLDHDEKDATRFEGYLFRALQLDPSKSRVARVLAEVKKLAGNRQKAALAGRLLVQLREVAPDGKLEALETDLARKDAVLIRGDRHPMVGWLSLPKGWKKGGEWPVLVAVDGAGSNFLGAARGFAGSRGARRTIVLAPCSFSNTNEIDAGRYGFYPPEVIEQGRRNRIEFDLEGLQSLLDAVTERFGGARRIGITGFSGGGNLCYGFTIRYPARVRFAAPACANFSGQGLSSAQPVEGGGPPIHIMTGAQDPHRDYTHGNKEMPGIEPQTDRAVEVLERLGFSNFKRTMLPGAKHSSLAKQVWEFADEVGG